MARSIAPSRYSVVFQTASGLARHEGREAGENREAVIIKNEPPLLLPFPTWLPPPATHHMQRQTPLPQIAFHQTRDHLSALPLAQLANRTRNRRIVSPSYALSHVHGSFRTDQTFVVDNPSRCLPSPPVRPTRTARSFSVVTVIDFDHAPS